ncbi:MAG: hypothetical protein QOH88_3585 [Verrucomicrobiota bacterium]
MPMSNALHLPTVLHFAGAIEPLRVLDVGVGLGTYGFLLRQYLDIGYQRLAREDWKMTIDGIEIFQGYRNAVWEYAYDQIWIGDIRQRIGTLGRYDLVLCNDVLEHFEKREAKSLFRTLLKMAGTVIATTPNREFPQGAWAGNEAETHHSLLAIEDFDSLVAWKQTGVTNCYVCSDFPPHRKLIQLAAATCPTWVRPSRLSRILMRLGFGEAHCRI